MITPIQFLHAVPSARLARARKRFGLTDRCDGHKISTALTEWLCGIHVTVGYMLGQRRVETLMIRMLSIAGFAAMSLSLSTHAQVDEDELVRLPGQGEVRNADLRERAMADRLKPGAGLFLTFDQDENGRISTTEIEAGIPVAFESADKNADGYLTALEQQDWAAGLPTRDDSLANPFRFDPNLDRRVDLEEFTLVINNLGLDYADETSGDILVADLKAPKVQREDRRERLEEVTRPRQGERNPSRRNQSANN